MSSTFLNRYTEVSAQVALNSTGDKFVFSPGRPINIIRWGFIADALVDVGAGLTIALDHRVTAASDTGRVNGATASGVDTVGGTLTTTADVAAGKGLYRDVSPKFEVDPGEEAVFEVTDAADTAGTGFVFIEYEEEGFSGGLPGVALTLSNRISNMTLKTS